MSKKPIRNYSNIINMELVYKYLIYEDGMHQPSYSTEQLNDVPISIEKVEENV